MSLVSVFIVGKQETRTDIKQNCYNFVISLSSKYVREMIVNAKWIQRRYDSFELNHRC